MQKLDDPAKLWMVWSPSLKIKTPMYLTVLPSLHWWFGILRFACEREGSLEFQPTRPPNNPPPNHYLNVEPSLFSSCFFRQRSNGLEYSRRSQIFSFQNLDLESLLTKLNSTDLSLFQHQLSGKKVQLLLSSSKVLCARCMYYPNWNERSHFVDSSTICLSKVDWRNSGTPFFSCEAGKSGFILVVPQKASLNDGWGFHKFCRCTKGAQNWFYNIKQRSPPWHPLPTVWAYDATQVVVFGGLVIRSGRPNQRLLMCVKANLLH